MSRWWAGKSDEGIIAMFRVDDIGFVQEHDDGIIVFLKDGKHFITETFDMDGFARHVLTKHDHNVTPVEALNFAIET